MSRPAAGNTRGIVIFGVHRSGTTLLQRMLAASPSVEMVADEIQGLKAFGYDLRSLLRDAKGRPEDICRLLVEHEQDFPFVKHLEARDAFLDCLERQLRSRTPTVRAVFEGIVDCFKMKCSKRVLGLKYPCDVASGERFLGWFPGWKPVLIVRDPRAVIASKLRDPTSMARRQRLLWPVWRWGTVAAYLYEIHHVTRLREVTRSSGVTVRYEDLIRDPRTVLEDLTRQLGIEFVEAMLQVEGKASSFGAGGAATPQDRKWRTELGAVEIKLITSLAKRFMIEFGYEVAA